VSKKSWYKRKHQFTPYTKADGQAVSDEFDAIQTSFERIPEMRDDGKGFEDSPLIPDPTDPMHPVPLKMLTETEESVNNARDDVTAKAKQVAQNTQSVAANTLTATQKADTATQAAASAQSSQQAASNAENMAHKWAASPVNEVVQGDKYSAFHYATKAAQSETTASSAAITSKSNADIATSKAEEAVKAAERAKSLANGEIEYEKILNVPSANTQTKGIVQLTSSVESESEELGLTAKAGKYLASLIAKISESLTGYIKTTSKSSSIDSESNETVATSNAVKQAYDKAVEANNNADGKVSKSGDTLTGDLSISSGDYSGLTLYNNDKHYMRIEGAPHRGSLMLNLIYRNSENRNVALVSFRKKGGIVAYLSDVVNLSGGTMTGKLKLPNLEVTENGTGESIKIGDDAYIGDVNVANSVGIKGNTDNNQGYIAFGNAKKRFGYDGNKFIADGHLEVPQAGHGAYVNQYTAYAPYIVTSVGSIGRDTYHPFIKGLVNSAGAYGSAFSFGYTTSQSGGAGFGRGVIHLIEDNGHQLLWTFEHNGDFVSSGDVKTGSRSLNKAHQDDSSFVIVKQSGNLGGLHVNRQDGKGARLELNGYRFKIWVEDRYDILFPERGGTLALTSEVVSDIRLGSVFYRQEVDGIPGGGYVLAGSRVQGGTRTLEYKPIQKLVNGNWYTISG
jgi:hypothetical protein